MTEEMDRLLEETRRRLRESEALFRVSQAFTSVLDLDELLQVIIDSAVETIDSVERGVIHILDEASGELQPKALSGKALGALRERKMRLGEGVAGYALEQGKAINVPDVTAEPRFVRDRSDPGLKSLLVVPLILGQKRIGTLSVDSERVGAFTEDDERLLTTLATQAAIAIENARLYEELREELVERRRAEEELRKSERRYRLLAENVTDVIWTMDMSLRFTYVSPSVTRMLGYSVKEVMATTLQEILPPASYEVITRAFAEELAIEEREEKDLHRSKTLELEVTCKDGSTVWTEATMTFLRDPDGQPVGILGVTRDITERKAVDGLKSSIVANVSHEFRAPLASIKAYTELLLDELDEGDRATRYQFLTVIDEETDRLTALVNDFLDLSRLESGRFELTR
jgi:PAS domain S-box-containing protein